MSVALLYALGCLFFAAVNDFIFKLVSKGDAKGHSCGKFVSIVGFCMLLAYAFMHTPFQGSLAMTLQWGCLSGFLSLASNVLVIESMRYLSAGVSSTIFRLNMVLVVLGAWLFLGEAMNCLLICGVICAICAIISLMPYGECRKGEKVALGFGMALLACVLRAGMSLSYKYAFSHGADLWSVQVISAAFWAVGGIVILFFQEHKLSLPSNEEWKKSLISGVFTTGIVFCMARMNASGNASIVNPIAQMSFLGTMLLSSIFLKEKITLGKSIAMILGIVAVVLLCI